MAKKTRITKVKKLAAVVGILFALSAFRLTLSAPIFSAECSSSCSNDDLDNCIKECNKLLDISINATKPHEQRMEQLQETIANIDANVETLTGLIARKKAQIETQEKKLGGQQKDFEVKVRNYYEKSYQFGTNYLYTVLFSHHNTGDAVRNISYRQNFINSDKQTITNLVLQLIDLNKARETLEENQNQLTNQKAQLETILAPIRDLVKGAKAYQSQLSQTAAGLTKRQEELLAQKTGNFQTSVGDVPPADDPASRPDYNPGFSPAYAGFSFGAPHRKGMSQYGAFGRAKQGQSAEDILKAYYGGSIEIKKDYSTSVNIAVQGYGTYKIEDYVKRIYEVPNSWGDEGGYEALKAQAVAARSYALAYTSNGSGSICASESCQVFQAGEKGGNWGRAVDETRGWVLVANGQPFSAWYAATSGGYNYSYAANGYSTPGGWDTKCGNQSCWTNDAYEKIAGSPWFYKAWYRPRYTSPSRSHPWLNKEEFVDIVNAVLLFVKDNGTLSHLSQTDKSNPDTWSRDEVRSHLGGDAVSEVNGISVTYSTGGYTSSVHLETDKGGKDIGGDIFRQIFNIRAPGEIWLASALFNIEKK